MPGEPGFLLAAGSTGMDHGQVIEVEPGRFEEMVVTALDGLPEELGQQMRNVVASHSRTHGIGKLVFCGDLSCLMILAMPVVNPAPADRCLRRNIAGQSL